jgi:uncharacterized protein (TIRG00374 family)
LRGFLLGILLAGVLLAILLSQVDTAAVGHSLQAAVPGLLLLALSLRLIAMILKAWRWGRAIESGSGVPLREGLLSASMVGYAANLIMPARLGEVARVMVLRRHLPVARMLTLTSAGVCQLLDLMFLVSLMVGLALWGFTSGVVELPALGAAVAVILLIFAGLVGVGRYRDLLTPRVEAFGRRLPPRLGNRVVGFFTHATGALRPLRDPRVLALLLAYTVSAWAFQAAGVWAALETFHVSVGVATVLLLMAALNLTFVVPLTPGNVGMHQLVSVLVLSRVGIEPAHALAFSIGLQGSMYVATLTIGAVFFWREGLDLATLRRSSLATAAPADATAPPPPDTPDRTSEP